MKWLIKLGDALSQFLNVLLLNGDPNHSISGDAWRFNRHKTRAVLDFVFYLFEKDHCYRAHLHDVRKATKLAQEWNNDLRMP
jgi:hypothetical protein